MADNVHWKALTDPEYLGAWFLAPDREIVLTIKDVVRRKAKNDKGKTDDCTVIIFAEKGVKPMIINPTNAKIITKIYGSPVISDWIGKKIQIFIQKNVEAFGEKMDVLRIRPKSPELPVLSPAHPRWAEVLQKVSSGAVSLEAVKHSFRISPEHEKFLIKPN